ncbi:MAG: hypothetical protein AAF334_08850, partial [Pseudomonadota bacterium]
RMTTSGSTWGSAVKKLRIVIEDLPDPESERSRDAAIPTRATHAHGRTAPAAPVLAPATGTPASGAREPDRKTKAPATA